MEEVIGSSTTTTSVALQASTAELSRRRPELVVGGGDQCLGAGIVGGGELGEDRQHRGDAIQRLIGVGHRERDIGTEAVPGDDHRSVIGDNVDRRPHIELLGIPPPWLPVEPPAAEVEAEHIPAGVDERSGGRVDDHISARAAVERVGVTDDGSAHGVGGVSRSPSRVTLHRPRTGWSRPRQVPCRHRTGSVPRVTAENSLHDDDRLPVKMLNDRILVKLGDAEGERRSSGGILIPATAQVGKRLTWAEIVAVGPNVRTIESGDQVLFNPEDRYEVEVNGTDYIVLRERDIHAVAAERLDEGSTGLYL